MRTVCTTECKDRGRQLPFCITNNYIMENKTEYTMIKELIAKENRKQVVKVILGGAAVGIGGALSLVLFLNMLVAFDWISDAIVRIIGGL